MMDPPARKHLAMVVHGPDVTGSVMDGHHHVKRREFLKTFGGVAPARFVMRMATSSAAMSPTTTPLWSLGARARSTVG